MSLVACRLAGAGHRHPIRPMLLAVHLPQEIHQLTSQNCRRDHNRSRGRGIVDVGYLSGGGSTGLRRVSGAGRLTTVASVHTRVDAARAVIAGGVPDAGRIHLASITATCKHTTTCITSVTLTCVGRRYARRRAAAVAARPIAAARHRRITCRYGRASAGTVVAGGAEGAGRGAAIRLASRSSHASICICTCRIVAEASRARIAGVVLVARRDARSTARARLGAGRDPVARGLLGITRVRVRASNLASIAVTRRQSYACRPADAGPTRAAGDVVRLT
jgi:hypothetical protein